MQVLLIEDEKNIVSFISKGLEDQGCRVTAALDGESGLSLLGRQLFDVIILDIILPTVDGWEVCRRIRNDLRSDVPILILSALNQTEQVVRGLDAGADDYLGKPFKMTELYARVKALCRRYSGRLPGSRYLIYADLRLDLQNKEVWRGENKIQLTVKEFNLLKLFLSNPDKVLTRHQILEQVWGMDFDTGTNVVDVYMNYLRKKIDKGYRKRLLNTVFGMGYMLREHDAEE